jgi:hypothetical protein
MRQQRGVRLGYDQGSGCGSNGVPDLRPAPCELKIEFDDQPFSSFHVDRAIHLLSVSIKVR